VPKGTNINVLDQTELVNC